LGRDLKNRVEIPSPLGENVRVDKENPLSPGGEG